MESYDDEDEPDEGRGEAGKLNSRCQPLTSQPPPPLSQEFGLMMMINMNMMIISMLMKSNLYAQTTSNKSVAP